MKLVVIVFVYEFSWDSLGSYLKIWHYFLYFIYAVYTTPIYSSIYSANSFLKCHLEPGMGWCLKPRTLKLSHVGVRNHVNMTLHLLLSRVHIMKKLELVPGISMGCWVKCLLHPEIIITAVISSVHNLCHGLVWWHSKNCYHLRWLYLVPKYWSESWLSFFWSNFVLMGL